MHTTLPSIAVLLLAAAASAQQNIVHHDDPNPALGRANAFPFGSEGTRIQQLIPQSVLGGIPQIIQDLFVNPQINSPTASTVYNVSQVYYGDFEIRMGTTQLSTLTNDWASNLPMPTTVYRGPLLVRFVRDEWVPLGLPASFLWLPLSPADNLVIDFIQWQVLDRGAVPPDVNGYFLNVYSSQTGGISRAYRRGWTAAQPATSAGVDGAGIKLGFLFNDGNFVGHDGSCPGSSGQVPAIGTPPGSYPQLGSPFTIELSQGPAGLAASLVLGFSTAAYGPFGLPFDLAPFGAPGCVVWSAPEASVGIFPLDPTGAASFQLALPNLPQLSTLRVHASWICIDPTANLLGLVPSGYGTMIL